MRYNFAVGMGHSGGMSLTFDRYDGDQVMQILSTDVIYRP